MAHNYKPRCAARLRYSSRNPQVLHSLSNLNITPLSGKGMPGRPLYFRTTGPVFGEITGTTQRETTTLPRVAAALFGVALGLVAGALAFQYIELETHGPAPAHTPRTPEPPQYVALASLAPTGFLLLPNDTSFGLKRQKAELSPELGSSSVRPRRNVEKPQQATPVPAYLLQPASVPRPYNRETTAAPKGDLGHEYWRAISSSSNVIERYQLYLQGHATGVLAEMAVNRIRELSQGAKKVTRGEGQPQIVKPKKSEGTSKQGKPSVTRETAVALPSNETDSQCRDKNGSKCLQPFPPLAKECTGDLSPEGFCVRKNYRTSTVVKR